MADAGFRLIPMFQKGEKAIKGMMDEAERIGASLSKDEMVAFDALNQSLIDLEMSADAFAQKLSSKLAGALATIIDLAKESTDALSAMLEEEKKIEDLSFEEQIKKQTDKLNGLRFSLLSADSTLAAAINVRGLFEESGLNVKETEAKPL